MNLSLLYNMSGASANTVFERLGGEAQTLSFVKKFPSDKTFSLLKESFESSDVETAFRAAHTLKGVAATLGFEKLRSASSELTEILRNKTFEGAAEPLEKTEKEYLAVVNTIKTLD